MNIGFFAPVYLPEKNGAVARIRGLCKGLTECGNKVFLFVPSKNKFSKEEDKYCTVYRIPYPKFIMGNVIEDKLKFNFGRYSSFHKTCAKLIQEENIDVLHARQPFDLHAIALKLGKKFSIPVFLESHRLLSVTEYALGNWSNIKHKLIKNYEVSLLNKANAVVTLSDTGAKELENYGVKTNLIPICNSYNVDMAESNSEKLKLKYKHILFYNGTLRKTEGLQNLIRAIPYLSDLKSFVVVVAGSGEEKQNLEKLAEELNVTDKIIFTGKISDELMKAYYENATLLLHPRTNIEYQMNFVGIKVYDSLHFSLPVLTSDFGVLSDFIRTHNCGMLSMPDDPKSFAQSVLKALKPVALKKLKLNSKKASKLFTWKVPGQKLTSVYVASK